MQNIKTIESCCTFGTQPVHQIKHSMSSKICLNHAVGPHLAVYEWGTSQHQRSHHLEWRWALWMNRPEEDAQPTALTVTCTFSCPSEAHQRPPASGPSSSSSLHMPFVMHHVKEHVFFSPLLHLRNMSTCITTMAWMCAYVRPCVRAWLPACVCVCERESMRGRERVGEREGAHVSVYQLHFLYCSTAWEQEARRKSKKK